jgi:putative flippase GtrA
MTVQVPHKGLCQKPALPRAGGPVGSHDAALPARERLLRFLLIGVISTAVDISLLYVLTEFCTTYYLASASVSYCCGILVNYALNKQITFRDASKKYLRQFVVFAAVSFSGLILNLIILFIAADLLTIHYLAGKGFATGISLVWNYFGQSRITFHRN